MRTFVSLLMLAGCAVAGRLENTYLPPPGAAQAGGINLATPFTRAGTVQAPQNTYLAPGLRAGSNSFSSGSAFSSGSSGFNSGNSFSSSSASSAANYRQQQQQQQQAFQQATPRPALIIKQLNDNPGDGTYTFSYETENGIQAEERGLVRADGAEGLAAVQGAYAFTAPDNNVRYTVTYTADENGFLAYGDHLPTPPPVPAEILRAHEQNAPDEARGLVDDGQYRAEHHGQQQQQQGGFLRGGSTGYSSGGYSSTASSTASSSSSSNNNNNNNGGYRY